MEILYKCIDLVRAEEATWTANATRTAQLRVKDYEKQMKRWQEAARPIRIIDPAVTVQPQHAAWFAANGLAYRVVEETKSGE